MKQVTITRKQMNKGAKGILDMTNQLSQVLKQFDGIYSNKLPDTDGLTVESYMAAFGVRRFEKNGKKKGYTPALLNAGWHDGMKLMSDDGKVMGNMVFRNVVATYSMSEADKDVYYKVYTKEEAEKVDGKPISRYELVQIPENRWSVNTILKGLRQGANFEKNVEKMAESAAAWGKIIKDEDCYIVVVDKDTKERKVVKVSHSQVQF